MDILTYPNASPIVYLGFTAIYLFLHGKIKKTNYNGFLDNIGLKHTNKRLGSSDKAYSK